MLDLPARGKTDEAENTVEFLLCNRGLIDTVDIFPWTYTKHTRVDGVERTEHPDTPSSEEIVELATYREEAVWDKAPRFLHPNYRMASPWSVE
uniref:Uncharacterized protein n=1 Tax=Candidatus Kentrum sp. FW TaxID=2126338 RepID=A0A450SZG0_9GAMM|nr:MAG: hypothetical protein BECKFW1821A_GA0114235_109113 [Candidatus Kentron sp. FW]VFJ67098.1 MAG: hypothetical protein BECKFW1821B_GA0114236_11262 [Candidatus Kentron sp. FW]